MMDTLKEYIEMCEKAVEIQKKCKREVGDYFFYNDGFGYRKNFGIWLLSDEKKREESYMDINWPANHWLPRQDQLQEMLGHKIVWKLIIEFDKFVNLDIDIPDSSMEQLWLAFVMYEKYNKIWDESEWATKH